MEISEQRFKLINRLVGIVVFITALLVYVLTIEPTVSWWDCGEFLSCSDKLQIGHPPGAPLYLMLARILGWLAPGVEYKAAFMNALSAIASGATVMILYFTIVHLLRRLIVEKWNMANIVLTTGAAVVGSLSFAFTDTFWNSAIEAEVYALSSFFTAIVFYLILKWEEHASDWSANRYLVLIAYLMGLSIGVHLLNLLAIPAIAVIIYQRKLKPVKGGVWLALLSGGVLLLITMYVIIPGFPKLASYVELLAVNVFRLPFQTGLLLFLALVLGGFITGIWYTGKRGWVTMNLSLTIVAVFLLGYSSYAMILIRSNATPLLNQNDPSHIYNLQSYLNRESYGDKPLFYGPYYNAEPSGYEAGNKGYEKWDGRYEPLKTTQGDYKYPSSGCTIFPRMHSSKGLHVQGYQQWTGMRKGQQPNFATNISFLLNYQVGFMYLRYLMWNFSGRQNDIQGNGGIENGNWITGISWLDGLRLGNQDRLPKTMKENKGRNKYYLLPFLLGILGIVFLYYGGAESQRYLWVLIVMFFFTGLAIVFYLNQTPYEPRERDYAYVGSFYVFAIWMGIGVAGIYKQLQRWVKSSIGTVVASVIAGLFVTGLLLTENYDDHDRSNRYIARDVAKNYLDSCPQDAILFTYGDNDTYPLWYMQHVEGYRTDVRICNLNLLNFDWYIDQMKRTSYKSERLPIRLERKNYLQGRNDYAMIGEGIDSLRIEDALRLVFSGDENYRVKLSNGEKVGIIPTRNLRVGDTAIVKIQQKYLLKNELVLMDLIANNRWNRPICLNKSALASIHLDLAKYAHPRGLVYWINPFKRPNDVAEEYDLLVNQYNWGDENQDFYKDHYTLMEPERDGLRRMYSRLAMTLVQGGRKDSAQQVLQKLRRMIPSNLYPANFNSILVARAYYSMGDKENGRKEINILADQIIDKLTFYLSLRGRFYDIVENQEEQQLSMFEMLIQEAQQQGDEELRTQLNQRLDQLTANL
ncbi:DUF2723 domain-containing protein [Puteibacter caeruleilacunae]|nr:DUF2723 domain-containing protein [Puteibacter caeruleilacunae]